MAARKAAAPKAEETRTLLVKTRKETFKITIPASYKVTFAKVNPNGTYGEEYALRIYETDSQQRAVFMNVEQFRDLSLPVVRVVTQRKGKTEYEKGPKGRKITDEETVETYEEPEF